MNRRLSVLLVIAAFFATAFALQPGAFTASAKKSQPSVVYAAKKEPLQLPTGPGICVSVEDDEGVIDIGYIPELKPDPGNPGQTEAALMSMVNLIGHKNNRPDVVRASGKVILSDGLTTEQSGGGSGGCHTVCSCATPIYCSQASMPLMSDDASSVVPAAVRRRPRNPGAGICGCGGGCGPCEKCKVTCS